MKSVSTLLQKYKESPHSISRKDKDELIMEHAPMIKYIAQKIAMRLPRNIELDDLMSAGVIGLMDAIEKYDHTRDNKFKTYAEFRIRGAILDELRSQDWVPRSVREKAKTVGKAISSLETDLGRVPTEEEVAEKLGLKINEYFDLLETIRSISLLSLDDIASANTPERRSLLGLIENSKAVNPFKELSNKALKTQLVKAIKGLPEKQKLVLSLYYYEDLNLKEIGKVLEITESRVSQLHTQAILRLRIKLKTLIDDNA